MWKLIGSGIIGGIISSILFPLTSYCIQRLFNRSKLKIVADPQNPLLIRVVNNSYTTIRNAIGYIQIGFSESDLLGKYGGIKRSLQSPSDQFMMLSWAKNINGIISPEININQGDTPDLNVFRLINEEGLVVASEQGLDIFGATIRTLLNANKDYKFRIKVTAENIFPLTRNFIYNSTTRSIEPIS